MTIEELAALKDEWQKKLRLMDWKIEIVFCDERDLVTKNSGGQVSMNTHHRLATIEMLKQEQRKPEAPEIEQTLVHEMLHIVLAPLTWQYSPESPPHILEEQAIHVITEAITGKPNGGVVV